MGHFRNIEKRGLFIVFEGSEAAGKSTQAELLYERLKENNVEVYLFSEPGATVGGDKIRELLLGEKEGKDLQFVKEAELLLFYASRAQLVHEKIVPALQDGAVVICDRFNDSSMAYQHYAKGIAKKYLNVLDEMVVDDCKPDLSIFLTYPLDKLKERICKRGIKNSYDAKNGDFFGKLARAYREIYDGKIEKYGENSAIMISTDETIDRTQAKILQKLRDTISRRGLDIKV